MIFNVKEMQEIETDLLRETVKICNNHNIDYFVDYGTCLGTVRHEGFIPWDSDIDISIPNDQIDSFVEYANKELPDNYYVDYYKVKKNSLRKFPRVCLKGYDSSKLHIDVYRLIYYPNSIEERKQFYKELNDNSWLNNVMKSNPIRLLLIGQFTKFITYLKNINNIKIACKQYEELCVKYNNTNYKGIALSDLDERYIVPSEMLNSFIYGKFDDIEVRIPEKYDEYLTHIYGDYMKYPDEKTRNELLSLTFKVDKE